MPLLNVFAKAFPHNAVLDLAEECNPDR